MLRSTSVLVVVAAMLLLTAAEPELSAEGDKVYVNAADLILRDPSGTGADISLRDLLAQLKDLRSAQAALNASSVRLEGRVGDLQANGTQGVGTAVQEAINTAVGNTSSELEHIKSDLHAINSTISTVTPTVQKAIDNASESILAVVSNNTAAIQANQASITDIQTNGVVVSESVQAAIDAAIDGLAIEQNEARSSAIETLQTLVDRNTAVLTGFPELRESISTIGADVAYLITHADNVTRCAQDSGQHIGNGTCAPAVKQCPVPSAPRDGSVVVSNPRYIVPGVTAQYSCNDPRDFISGGDVRVCSEETFMFTPAVAPTCKQCLVPNCLRCAGVEDVCRLCAFGHDLTADGKSCLQRKDFTYVFGWNIGGHNGIEGFQLSPGATSWTDFQPRPSQVAVKGAGTIIEGNIFIVSRNGNTIALAQGSTTWNNAPSVPYPGRDCCTTPFFATINGVSVSADGFYHFATAGSAVFKLNSTGSGFWTRYPPMNTIRSSGATAVIDSKIYLLGGQVVSTNRPTDLVSIWDAKNDVDASFDDSTLSLPSPRYGHAATGYGGKIYIFGGVVSGARSAEAISYDFDKKVWTRLTDMPDGWSFITSGPLPVFPNGDVLLPGAQSFGGDRVAYKYSATNNTWQTFAPTASNRFGGNSVILMGTRS